MPYSITHVVASDTYNLAYSNLIGLDYTDENSFSNGKLVPDGEWTAFVSPYAIIGGGIGLLMVLEDASVLEFLTHPNQSSDEENLVLVEFPDRQITLRVEHFEDGTLVYSHSLDLFTWTEVARFTPEVPVSEVGVVLRYDREDWDAIGSATQAHLLPGIWQNIQEEVWLGLPDPWPAQRDVDVVVNPLVSSTAEPLVHGIVGAQFGDLEFDVGKSVRWTQWFVDNLHVTDVNLGNPRYWIVNWTQTFPDVEHTVTGINFFERPEEFRKEQWRLYKQAFGTPHDSEWFLFIDAHEGFSVDNRTLPNDYAFAPFMSFLWREIQRAIDAGQPYVTLPFYVFLRSGNITNVSYTTLMDQLEDPNTTDKPLPVLQAISVPYYLPYQGLKRLWNASELNKPDFDWKQLDIPVTPSAGAKAQIISYGYAHWNLQDIEPPATTVPPIDANNDDGWKMRKLLSQVKPITGLPVGSTWVAPASDPAGLPGPWAPADANNPDPINPDTGAPISQPVAADPSLLGLVTPLYDCVFRINMRDGVWYESGVSGNIPLVWDGTKWTTNYDPALWAEQGVDSYDPTAVP